MPIEGAQIELLDIKQTAQPSSLYMSDKNGNFTASSIMRKMIFGFPAYHIKITKKGFQILERKLDLKGKNGPIVYKLIEE